MPQFEVRRNERIPLESSSTAFFELDLRKARETEDQTVLFGRIGKAGRKSACLEAMFSTQVVRKMHVVERFFKTKAQVRALVVDREVTHVAKKAADSADGCVAPGLA